MARGLDTTRPLDREVRRVVRRRVRAAITTLDRALQPSTGPAPRPPCEDAVHAARRHCKEVRALIRLVDMDRGAGEPLDRSIRAAGRALAPVRDAHVAAALAATTEEGRAAQPAIPDDHRIAIVNAIARLTEALGLVGELRFDDPAVRLRTGLGRTYRHSRGAYRRARRRPTPDRLHRWRIWNKRLWYQIQFLAITAPSVLVPLAELLDDVGEALGDIHDLDVHHASAGARDRFPPSTADEEERAHRVEAVLRRGATIHVERPRAFVERIVRLWSVAVADGPEPGR